MQGTGEFVAGAARVSKAVSITFAPGSTLAPSPSARSAASSTEGGAAGSDDSFGRCDSRLVALFRGFR